MAARSRALSLAAPGHTARALLAPAEEDGLHRGRSRHSVPARHALHALWRLAHARLSAHQEHQVPGGEPRRDRVLAARSLASVGGRVPVAEGCLDHRGGFDMSPVAAFGLGRIAAVLMLIVLFLIILGVLAFTEKVLLILFVLIAIALLL